MPDTYTHGHADAVLRSHRWRTVENSAAYLAPHLRPDLDLLDVGCGPGTLTIDLARRVRSAVGIDLSATVVDEARATATDSAVENVRFLVGDFREAGLAPASFDVVHAHQVLQHLSDPVGALRAMAALVRPGGLVAVRDGDYAGFIWAPRSAALARWSALYDAVCRHNRAEPDAGRFLPAWARAAGLTDVTYSVSTWTFATPENRTWWSELWAERCVASTFALQAVNYGLSDQEELDLLAAGFRSWGADPDGVCVVPHGELLARV